MNGWIPLPLPLADAITTTRWGFARLQDMNQRWHWLLLLVVCLAVLVYVIYTYYRDSIELPRGVTFSLLLLRVFAFGAILFSFLDLEKKTERVLVKQSRVVLLVDTSQSMGLKDTDPVSGAVSPRRVDEVIAEFERGGLIEELREKHDVTVMHFDQGSKPQAIGSFASLQRRAEIEESPQTEPGASSAALWQLRGVVLASCAAGVVALVLGLIYFTFSGGRLTGVLSWLLFLGVLLALGGLVAAAVAHLSNSQIPLRAALGGRMPKPDATGDQAGDKADDETNDEAGEGAKDEADPAAGDEDDGPQQPSEIDWKTVLAPQGRETRLGDSLADVVQRERGGPLAGIAVFTDGRNNAGVDCEEAVSLAGDADIPIYPIGMGSDKQPANVRLVDVEAPPRVFPGDKFPINAFLQGYGLEGRRVRIELSSAPADGTSEEEISYDFEEEVYVRLGSGDSVIPIKFEVVPELEGRRYYRVSADPLDEEADERDNQMRSAVEIVERKNNVLLFSDGPTREFRFLRNMLYRDKDVTVDVCLQSAQAGISQDADEILTEFPVTEQELFEKYDCIIALDPDWSKLDLDQVQLLDRWVAEKAGGLILIAGAVHTPEWVRRQRGDERIDLVKALHPVVFDRWGAPSRGQPTNDTAWALDFTREGDAAEFLWLADTAIDSEGNWATFDGVYGYYDSLRIKQVKPGATVYARFSDPQKVIDDQLPPYLAAQFYGAGRVFFMGSGEMWRLRAVDEEFFETFYTKLVRHVSQGRLLRDSSRGVLMLSKQRCLLGDTIMVRAHLSDRQFQPLEAPQVEATLVMPDEQRMPLVLMPVEDAPRRGLFAGQFTALTEGDYRVELMIPDSDDADMLAREVRARMPDLEVERPQRDDATLKGMAKQTGGEYYVGMAAALGKLGAAPLSSVIEPNDVPTTLPDTPDTDFDRLLMGWLLAAICIALSGEWLIRRLSKLA